MSFSREIKRELVKCRLKTEDVRRAQLAGLTHAAGSLQLGLNTGLQYKTETHEVGLHIASLLASLYELDVQVALRDNAYRRVMVTTVFAGGKDIEALFTDTGVLYYGNSGIELPTAIPGWISNSRQCRKAFLRGAFLGAGSISNPRNAYHMEIVCQNTILANLLEDFMNDLSCEAKTVRRKERTVLYLKEGDRIASFLALMGAHGATLLFEDARVEKEFRNYINRTSNCETANIGKTVNAAGEQLEAIHRIMQNGSLEKLSSVLRETAEIRLNNPEASLQELADMAGVGKSGMNHRLQRLIRLAGELM